MTALQAPPLPPEYGSLQVWWQQVLASLKEVLAEQQAQIDALTALNSDDVLTPAKKPVWIFMHSFLTGEQAGLDAQATSYSIATEKTTYDNAVSALTTHLGTLTTPVAWNNLAGDTTIVGTTFRTKFNDVLVAKQALINKITANAKVLADAANTAAGAAQSTADTVKRDHAINTGNPIPGEVLTAADVGSSATITIAAHDRRYGDKAQVAVNGGTVTGLAFSTAYYVYYDQLSRAGGAVSYAATSNWNVADPNKTAGRHFVGEITTPADGGGGTTGGAAPPAAGGGGAKEWIGVTS